MKETILKEFREKFRYKFDICEKEERIEVNGNWLFIEEFISQAIDQTIEETISEAIRKIEKIKIAVAKQTGAYKYNSCYEDCIDILNKLKK